MDQLKGMFVKQFAARGGASFIGKAMPFGIGAAIGGAGNHILGRRVLTTSHRAFGAAPLTLPAELEPVPGAEKMELRMLRGALRRHRRRRSRRHRGARSGWVGHRVGEIAGRRREHAADEIEAGESGGDHDLPPRPGSDATGK